MLERACREHHWSFWLTIQKWQTSWLSFCFRLKEGSHKDRQKERPLQKGRFYRRLIRPKQSGMKYKFKAFNKYD